MPRALCSPLPTASARARQRRQSRGRRRDPLHVRAGVAPPRRDALAQREKPFGVLAEEARHRLQMPPVSSREKALVDHGLVLVVDDRARHPCR